MATAERYTLADGTTRSAVRFRIDGNSTGKRGFPDPESGAGSYGNEIEVAKTKGAYVRPADGRVTIAALADGWVERQPHLKPSSARPLAICLRLHVLPVWGAHRVADIRPSAVKTWIAELSGRYSATVVIRCAGILRGLLDDAVADRLLSTNPAAGIKLPRKTRKAHTYLDHGQLWALATAAGSNGALVLTLGYTGLRWGEAGALRVRDLDMLRRRLTVNETATRVGSEIIVGTPKSHKARSVPFPKALVPALAAQCEGKGRDDLLFPARQGGHQQQANSTRGWWITAVTRSGVPRVTPHDLRHTAASLAVSAGANVKAVQRMLGHASAAMTLDTYADLFSDDLDLVADRLDLAIEAAARTHSAG